VISKRFDFFNFGMVGSLLSLRTDIDSFQHFLVFCAHIYLRKPGWNIQICIPNFLDVMLPKLYKNLDRIDQQRMEFPDQIHIALLLFAEGITL
jgi:hypothetical protein